MTIAQQVIDLQTRHALSDEQAAQYLGVPVHTLKNWRTGKRVPAAVVQRLLDVLGTVEALAPAIHAHLMPDKG